MLVQPKPNFLTTNLKQAQISYFEIEGLKKFMLCFFEACEFA